MTFAFPSAKGEQCNTCLLGMMWWLIESMLGVCLAQNENCAKCICSFRKQGQSHRAQPKSMMKRLFTKVGQDFWSQRPQEDSWPPGLDRAYPGGQAGLWKAIFLPDCMRLWSSLPCSLVIFFPPLSCLKLCVNVVMGGGGGEWEVGVGGEEVLSEGDSTRRSETVAAGHPHTGSRPEQPKLLSIHRHDCPPFS